jgi:hypothetical protein
MKMSRLITRQTRQFVIERALGLRAAPDGGTETGDHAWNVDPLVLKKLVRA